MVCFQTNGNWFVLLNFLLWNGVLAFGEEIGLMLEYVCILQIVFLFNKMKPINQKSHCQWILQVHKNILLFLETFHHPFKCSFFFPLPPVTKHCDEFIPSCLFLKTLISGPDRVCMGGGCRHVHMHLFISVSLCPWCCSVHLTCGLRKNRAQKL